MIRYDLQCDKGHEFDGWFSDSAAYDKLVAKKLVECSHCGTTQVEKQLMAPGIPAKGNRKSEPSSPMVAGPVDPKLREMMARVREIRAHVEQNAEHVGDKFAEEARKIHYGETEERGIYGKATPDEAKSLLEEGIAVHPLPMLPEDGN
jgi:hypothetical protein